MDINVDTIYVTTMKDFSFDIFNIPFYGVTYYSIQKIPIQDAIDIIYQLMSQDFPIYKISNNVNIDIPYSNKINPNSGFIILNKNNAYLLLPI